MPSASPRFWTHRPAARAGQQERSARRKESNGPPATRRCSLAACRRVPSALHPSPTAVADRPSIHRPWRGAPASGNPNRHLCPLSGAHTRTPSSPTSSHRNRAAPHHTTRLPPREPRSRRIVPGHVACLHPPARRRLSRRDGDKPHLSCTSGFPWRHTAVARPHGPTHPRPAHVHRVSLCLPCLHGVVLVRCGPVSPEPLEPCGCGRACRRRGYGRRGWGGGDRTRRPSLLWHRQADGAAAPPPRSPLLGAVGLASRGRLLDETSRGARGPQGVKSRGG